METLVSVNEFCVYHQVEVSFVYLLEQRGLIQTTQVDQSVYVHPEFVARLEKLVRLHQDLAVHADDLDIVINLLDQLEHLQREVVQLQNRLAFYESMTEH
ncbi:hypothetical protein BN8_06222 [Fibrisoma limi BUZ 3]|uniref:MerR family transcriptional regulator n=1 Tax=Fibrisoma limi BUZ 3 TaxID=1185876 RepID=I2GSF6_9BACT|nr:chaperone modulator CbpM [Fibrisoma limi]CCH56835.1 hypothetical protein BN8_06222 [Fibrisoma limi BUZ 3]